MPVSGQHVDTDLDTNVEDSLHPTKLKPSLIDTIRKHKIITQI